MSQPATIRDSLAAAPSGRRRFDLFAVLVRFQSVIGLIVVVIGGIIFSPRRHAG